jgi:hypothetical protein
MKRYETIFLKELDKIPHNTVILSSFLNEIGIPHKIQFKYKKKEWLQSIGQGAFLKFDDKKATFEGAINTLQTQAKLKAHIGGLSALELNGRGHYVRVVQIWQIFAGPGITLPKWFTNYNFGDKDKLTFYTTSFLPYNKNDFKDFDCKTYTIKISNLERAILEAIYLSPKDVDLDELSEIFDLLSGLRPSYLQQLLETCNSIKVKRLFLYLAEKAGHDWFKYINTEKIDLGNGIREITQGGIYDNKYKIVIKKLSAHDIH